MIEEQTNENLNPNYFSKYVFTQRNPLIFCFYILSKELHMYHVYTYMLLLFSERTWTNCIITRYGDVYNVLFSKHIYRHAA